eukprot:g2767.t1
MIRQLTVGPSAENRGSVGNHANVPAQQIAGEGSVSRECVKDVFLEQGMIARVEFSLDDNDIEFSAVFKPVPAGVLQCRWSNHFSWLRSKHLRFCVDVCDGEQEQCKSINTQQQPPKRPPPSSLNVETRSSSGEEAELQRSAEGQSDACSVLTAGPESGASTSTGTGTQWDASGQLESTSAQQQLPERPPPSSLNVETRSSSGEEAELQRSAEGQSDACSVLTAGPESGASTSTGTGTQGDTASTNGSGGAGLRPQEVALTALRAGDLVWARRTHHPRKLAVFTHPAEPGPLYYVSGRSTQDLQTAVKHNRAGHGTDAKWRMPAGCELLHVVAVGEELVGGGVEAVAEAGREDFEVRAGIKYRLVTARRWRGEALPAVRSCLRPMLTVANFGVGSMAYFHFVANIGLHGGTYLAMPNAMGPRVSLAPELMQTEEVCNTRRRPFMARISHLRESEFECADEGESEICGALWATIYLNSMTKVA